jgi:hypothetical protein
VLIDIIKEYLAENIDWTKVDFVDNQDCLILIEKVLTLSLPLSPPLLLLSIFPPSSHS